MERSGDAINGTETVDELFDALLSFAVCTVAVLLMFPVTPVLTETVSVMSAAADPLAMGPGFVHVTVGPSCPTVEQVQFVPAADTNTNSLLRTSVTVIAPVVGPVPTLLTARLNVLVDPLVKLLVAVFTMARSGALFTATVSVEELFAALLSPTVATTAVFVRFPTGADALTNTVSAMLAAAEPLAIGPAFVQVTN
jgi:hypothetical protein